MVTQLDPVRYVVWDDRGAHSWVGPGDNALLTEYIHANFRVERVLGIYTILSRQAKAPLSETIGQERARAAFFFDLSCCFYRHP